jgi:hypothetical protein
VLLRDEIAGVVEPSPRRKDHPHDSE